MKKCKDCDRLKAKVDYLERELAKADVQVMKGEPKWTCQKCGKVLTIKNLIYCDECKNPPEPSPKPQDRCIHGVWKADHCYQCNPEPSPVGDELVSIIEKFLDKNSPNDGQHYEAEELASKIKIYEKRKIEALRRENTETYWLVLKALGIGGE
jgi:hypothetical protein